VAVFFSFAKNLMLVRCSIFVSNFSDEQQKHFLTHRRLPQHQVSVLQHASAHKWGKVEGQYPWMRFGAAGSSSGAANAVSLFNSRTSYVM
jgi:hypothetical protein